MNTLCSQTQTAFAISISLAHKQTDIQYWDDTLTEEIDVIQAIVDDIPKMRGGMKKWAAIDRCKSKVWSAASMKRAFKMEIRLIRNVGLRRTYERRLAQLDQQLKTLYADCKALESESARGELFVEAEEQFATGNLNGNGMDGVEAGDIMLKESHSLQDETQDSLTRIKHIIADSKVVGVGTLEELDRQRKVTQNIDKATDRVDDHLSRSEKLLKRFGRRMAWLCPLPQYSVHSS